MASRTIWSGIPARLLATSMTLFLAVPLVAQEADEESVATQIERAISQMESGDIGEIFGAADDLTDIGDAAIPALRRAVQESEDVWIRLGCLRALTDLEAVEPHSDRLLELAGVDQETEVRIAALDIIANLPRDRKVTQVLSDALARTYDPHVKVALSKTLYHVGDANGRKRSLRELKTLLQSENRRYRALGALALAEIGDIDQARPALLEIENDPTLEGRLARAYLQIEKTNRYWERRDTRRFLAENKPQDATADSQFNLLQEIIDFIRAEHIYGEQYQGDEGVEKLLTAAAKGMLSSLDRHSTYFSAEEYQKWLLDLQRNYAGIGAYVNTIGGFFTITRPIYSGPAYRVGLRSDDQIISVEGWETYNQPQQDVIDRLKGRPGTTVRIEVMRTGWRKPREFDIVRETINIPSVRAELFPGGVGYVEIETFGNTTFKELKVALDELSARGAQGFILDLRYNPGGYLREAIDMVGEFIGPRKLVVFTEGRTGQEDRREYPTNPKASVRNEPLVILINERSASASEIVSGALRYYERATLVGKKTFGKGSVQNPFPLESRQGEPFRDLNRNGIWDPNEDWEDRNKNGKYDTSPMFKLTTQLYYLPNGESIHTQIDADGTVKKPGGVTPDLLIDLETTAAWKTEELADLYERAVFSDYLEEHYHSRHGAGEIAEVLTEVAAAEDIDDVLAEHGIGRATYERWTELYAGKDASEIESRKAAEDRRRAANEKLFVGLSEGDEFEWSRYPAFDEFYTALDTHLDRNDIRRQIRLILRDRVADLRKKPFPGNRILGDYQEDSQLQLAIVELVKLLGGNASAIPEYVRFAGIEGKRPAAEAEEEEVRNRR